MHKDQIFLLFRGWGLIGGTSTLVFAEQRLLESVWQAKNHYDYVHLISSSEIPLMTKEYFKMFFTKDLYIGYSPRNKKVDRRLSFYYPIDHLNIRNRVNLLRVIKAINMLFCLIV